MFTVLPVLAVIIFSYLLGSINFAIIISRAFAKEDVRTHGSGNAGMTNMLRTYGKGPAALTAVGDFLKAIVAVFLSRMLFSQLGITFMDAGYLAGLFVILGHVYPLYFGFRGGKGVMTMMGVMLILNPLVFLIMVAIFVPMVFITRIVSLCSVLGAIVYPIATFFVAKLLGQNVMFNTIFSIIFAIIILVMHRENIKRLLNGTESKFGAKKK